MAAYNGTLATFQTAFGGETESFVLAAGVFGDELTTIFSPFRSDV